MGEEDSDAEYDDMADSNGAQQPRRHDDHDDDDDDDNDEQQQHLDLTALANSKRLKGKIRIAGVEEESTVAMKDRRDQARKKEMEVRWRLTVSRNRGRMTLAVTTDGDPLPPWLGAQDLLVQYNERPTPRTTKKLEVHRRPFYGCRRWLNCCVHVPIHEAVVEGNSRQVRNFMQRWSKRKEGYEMINMEDADGRSALALAIKAEREDLADIISAYGEANPNLGETCVACRMGGA